MIFFQKILFIYLIENFGFWLQKSLLIFFIFFPHGFYSNQFIHDILLQIFLIKNVAHM